MDNRDIKRLEDKIDKLLNMYYSPVFVGYQPRYYSFPIDCKFDVDVRLLPRVPTTATEAVILQEQEMRIKHIVYTHIKDMERDINLLLNRR